MTRPFSNKGFIDEDIIPLSFDTETHGLGGDLLCITAYDFKSKHFLTGDDMIARFFAILFEHPYPFVWFAHHAQYDWRYLMDYIRVQSLDCAISMRDETNIYQITILYNKEKFVMRDSMALFPGSLRQFADCFTPEIPKEHIDFDSGEVFDPDNEQHRHYAVRDVEILRKGLPRFNNMLSRHFGISMGHTTAGTALKAWQATLNDGTYYNPSEYGDNEEFIRSGYYGGLVFLTRVDEVLNVETYDINSSYPSQMKSKGVPGGQCAKSMDWEHHIGIFKVLIRTPDTLVVPIIPARNPRGLMIWRRGIFETTVTNIELEFATRHGYEVLQVIDGMVWEDMIFPFAKFIDRCMSIRQEYKGKPEETLAKLMQNSLYGKFGSRRERLKVFIPEHENETLDATPLDESCYWWMKKEFADNLRCIPEWAVFTTAHARLQLLETVYAVGIDHVIYGDTDSITIMSGHSQSIDVGDNYGQFKLEKRWKRFRALAPKVYSGLLDNGQYKGAAKGLPRKRMSDQSWEHLLAGDRVQVAYDTLPSLRQSIAHGITPARQVSRVSTDIQKSLNWELHDDRVRPRLSTYTERVS